MLSHIYLKDFAIIETLDLELKQGLTAFTGETGAGKSILIDAIGLVLGDRADSSVVRHGADKTEIILSVDINDTPNARAWLKDQDLNDEYDECILRRVITASGKSRAWINGTPSNLKMLRELGEQLVDIHGQHEHQSLMKKGMQRVMLDDYAENQTLLKNVETTYDAWKSLHKKIEQLNNQNSDHQAKIDLLSFQTQELDEFKIGENEASQLDEEHARLSNAGQLIEVSSQSVNKLYDDDENSIYAAISDVLHQIEDAKALDSSFAEPLELLKNVQIQIQEAADLVRRYNESITLDPERLNWVNQRISKLHELCRKHQTMPDKLYAKWQILHEELSILNSDDFDLVVLQEKLTKSKTDYVNASKILSKARAKAAAVLSKGVTTEMQQLGMDGGVFFIQINANENYTRHGLDEITFTVSANPGQPLKSLNKVASGGELSRISLAIQMIAAQKVTLPALIFDEVDSGIGGGIAEVVGKQLRKLGNTRQVLCVTHLPQVAACAHNHHKVSKVKARKNTNTGMTVLDEDQRIEEIARMMGGLDITPATRNLATEMLTH